jgi:hypothetical protein
MDNFGKTTTLEQLFPVQRVSIQQQRANPFCSHSKKKKEITPHWVTDEHYLFE